MIKNRIKAARPATLTVTVISTIFGMILAYTNGFLFKNGATAFEVYKIILVILGGIFLQSAVNMINNFFEEDVKMEIKEQRKYKIMGYMRSRDEVLDFKTAILFFSITAIIGVYLSYYSGIQLFYIEIVGIFSAYAYAGKPFNYKEKGLGALLSFIMMGPLLVYASYYVFAVQFSLKPILYSFTFGLFIPAILMSNELRDYEEDKGKNINTLTVRIGFERGKQIYFALMALAYINTLILVVLKELPLASILVITTIPLLKSVKTSLLKNKKNLVPITAKIHFIFGIELISTLLFTR